METMENNGYRVLIVDDEEGIREVYGNFLRKRGFEVETAVNGVEGLEKLLKGDFDVAVVDLRMPQLGGLEMVRQAKKEWINTRIIVITAHGDRSEVIQGLNEGVDYWFDKQTIDMNVFHEKVKELAPLIPPEVAERLLASIHNED